ncbi:phosphorylase [Salinimicrobium marinum]|uniref:Uridine phosphorylase n=1 Tax=Salinimicrobium marinum TaxID=680283 RepID=A0A918SBN5_9FLAO|nr:nucleoside phosphorylase [Salinimicrobium marinum]GHA30729.1 phosphorylase [Salinimicrobium marinum]
MNSLEASEFILNKDGSIYHLNLLPENLADTVIVVGDPERVEKVTKYFDKVDIVIKKREFHTQTGFYRGKRITVISTGIGTDNIDIVLNELDALVNINFKERKIKEQHTSLDIVRIGTSGSIQAEIPVDAFVQSEMAVGFDSLLHFYQSEDIQLQDFNQALSEHLQLSKEKSAPYVVSCNEELAEKLFSENIFKGFTGTNVGFYGPQGRVLRLPLQDDKLNDRMGSFSFRGKKVTNLEMETAAIYGLSKMLGHRAVSMNAIIANRATGEFSPDAGKTVDELIQYTLNKLVPEN